MRIAMIAFLLLFAIGNGAMVVLADMDDDPVTTTTEFKNVESASELMSKEARGLRQTSAYAFARPLNDSGVAIGPSAVSSATASAQTSCGGNSSPLRC
jgi:hypothetical protein